MGLITKKQIKEIRLWILSPRLEYLLLIIYILSFSVILYLRTVNMDGSALRNDGVAISNFKFLQEIQDYFSKSQLQTITTIPQIYSYIETMQNEKLWVEPGKRSPYWPVGTTRIVQYRTQMKSPDCVTSKDITTSARRL